MATRMARISSFFMGAILGGRCGRADRPAHSAANAQTVSRSRAPVSEDGWRSLDIARASI